MMERECYGEDSGRSNKVIFRMPTVQLSHKIGVCDSTERKEGATFCHILSVALIGP
jgi:hypothetical protein